MNILYLSGFESKQNKFLLATFVLFWVFTSIFYLYGLNFSDGLRFFLQINYFFFINKFDFKIIFKFTNFSMNCLVFTNFCWL